MSSKHLNKTHTALVFLLFCFYLNPFNFGFIFGYLTLLLLLFSGNLFLRSKNLNGVILLLFSITYGIFYAFDPELGTQFIFLYSIVPFVMFMAGANLVQNKNHNITVIVFLLSLALSIPSLVSVFLDIYENGFIAINRDVPHIWTGEREPATNTAGKLIMNMCIPGLLLINWKIFSQKKWIGLGALILFILSITAIIRLGSRTHLVIIVFTLFTSIIYKIARKGIARNVFLVILIFIVLNVAFVYFNINTDSEFLSAYADRADSRSHGVSSAGGRTWKWEKSAEYIFTKPMGWQLNDLGLSHNLWFDTARVSGTLGFILLIWFTLKISITAVKNIFKKYTDTVSFKLEGLLLVYIIAFNLLFFVEPIMEGYFNCFAMFCFLAGIQSGRFYSGNKRKELS